MFRTQVTRKSNPKDGVFHARAKIFRDKLCIEYRSGSSDGLEDNNSVIGGLNTEVFTGCERLPNVAKLRGG